MLIVRILPVLIAACITVACAASDRSSRGDGASTKTAQPASTPQSATGQSADTASHAPVPIPAAAPLSSALPADVAAYRFEREQCDHFRGEDAYDARRRQELKQQLDRFCKGTDARLAALRTKYVSQPKVVESLKDFDDQVE